MARKSGTFSQMSLSRIENLRVIKTVSVVALGLGVLGLAIALIAMVVTAAGSGVTMGTLTGLEASAARWSALGESYAPDYEAVAAVSSDRWTSMGEFVARSRARSADTAAARRQTKTVGESELRPLAVIQVTPVGRRLP